MRYGTGTAESRADELCNFDSITDNMAALGYVRDTHGGWIKQGSPASSAAPADPSTFPASWPNTAVHVRRHGRPRSHRAKALEPVPELAPATDTKEH